MDLTTYFSTANLNRINKAEDKMRAFLIDEMLPAMKKIIPFCCGTIGDHTLRSLLSLPTQDSFDQSITYYNDTCIGTINGTYIINTDDGTQSRDLPHGNNYAIKTRLMSSTIGEDITAHGSMYLRNLTNVIHEYMGFYMHHHNPNIVVANNCIISKDIITLLTRDDDITEDIVTNHICKLYTVRLKKLKSILTKIDQLVDYRIHRVLLALHIPSQAYNLSNASLDDKLKIGEQLLTLHKAQCKRLKDITISVMKSMQPLHGIVMNKADVVHRFTYVNCLSHALINKDTIELESNTFNITNYITQDIGDDLDDADEYDDDDRIFEINITFTNPDAPRKCMLELCYCTDNNPNHIRWDQIAYIPYFIKLLSTCDDSILDYIDLLSKVASMLPIALSRLKNHIESL